VTERLTAAEPGPSLVMMILCGVVISTMSCSCRAAAVIYILTRPTHYCTGVSRRTSSTACKARLGGAAIFKVGGGQNVMKKIFCNPHFIKCGGYEHSSKQIIITIEYAEICCLIVALITHAFTQLK